MKRTKTPQDVNSFELAVSVPSRVWLKICRANKKEKFLDAVAFRNANFVFDTEAFCVDNGIELSKGLRSLCDEAVKKSGKYPKPQLLASPRSEFGKI